MLTEKERQLLIAFLSSNLEEATFNDNEEKSAANEKDDAAPYSLSNRGGIEWQLHHNHDNVLQ